MINDDFTQPAAQVNAKTEAAESCDQSFRPEVVAALLDKEGGCLASIPALAQQYIAGMKRIPGAPPIDKLEPRHTRAIVAILTFQPDPHKDWENFVKHWQEKEDLETNANNPFLPRWFGKTEEGSVWAQDTGTLDAMTQTRITQIFYECQRLTNGTLTEMLRPAPIPDPEIMRSIVEAAKQFMNILFRPMGYDTGKNAEFRLSTTLPMLASFGYDGFRILANHIAEFSDEEDFQHYGSDPDETITADLAKSHSISGYPINIGLIDAHDVIDVLECAKLTQAPRWLPSLILLHVLKHTRYYQNLNGKPYLFAAYRGRFQFIALPENGNHSALGDGINRGVQATLQRILGISSGTGKKRTPCEIAVAGVLNLIIPMQITRPIPLYQHPEIIVAPGVSMMAAIVNGNEKKRLWIDPGISVHNVGLFNATSGVIDKRGAVMGDLAVSLEWPLSNATPDDVADWISGLPNIVYPTLPSNFVFGLIRNVTSLGHPKGLFHLFNGTFVLNMIRRELAGTPIGRIAKNEYPAIWALPVGGTTEETTNQGKTNFCRLVARMLVPNIDATQCSGSTSPPAQRSAASQIELYGTAIYDEFVPPKSPDHFLHTAGFVSLCTGGLINPGRALENSTGFKLQFPLFLAAKSGPEVEDMKNRSFMIFMDQLNEENRCNKEELSALMSGSASTILRLSTLLWINNNKIVERIRALEPESGKWRFNAHLAVVKMLAGDEYPEVEKYLEASWSYCDEQREKAVPAREELGDMRFEVSQVISNCGAITWSILWAKGKSGQQSILCSELLRIICESNGRDYSRLLTQYRIPEGQAVSKLKRRLVRGPVTTVVRETADSSGVKTAKYTLRLDPESDQYAFVDRVS